MKSRTWYVHLATRALACLVSGTFKAHGKTWDQKQNLWQVFIYGKSNMPMTGWNISICLKYLRQNCRPGQESALNGLLEEIYQDGRKEEIERIRDNQHISEEARDLLLNRLGAGGEN